jgi:hypothetical protein
MTTPKTNPITLKSAQDTSTIFSNSSLFFSFRAFNVSAIINAYTETSKPGKFDTNTQESLITDPYIIHPMQLHTTIGYG